MTPLPYPPALDHTARVRRAFALGLRPAALLCLTTCLAPAFATAQTQQQPATHKAHHRRAAAQPVPTPAPDPTPAPVAPPQPEQPKWPANDPPAPPAVTYNSQGLRIVAQNSSLNTILDQVSTETGAKVEGLNGDERVFGDYGPGQPREVLADLLNGVNYNVLIVGDQAEGLPLHVVLSPRHGGGVPQPNQRQQAQDQDEDYQPPEQEEPPQIFQPQRGEPMNRPMTPQERMEMMQERQREMQQQQQQQQPQPQPQ